MRFFRYLPLLLLPTFLLAADKSKAVKSIPPPAIAKLSWLAGSWRMEKDNRMTDEQWMAPAGGVMLGMGRTVAKGKVVDTQFMQIREGPGGQLFYVLQLSGQKEAAFQIKSLTETIAVFENQLQEFPRSVSYALQPDGLLSVVFDGASPDGQARRNEFQFQRMNR